MVRLIRELLSLLISREFCPHSPVGDTTTIVVGGSLIPGARGARTGSLPLAAAGCVFGSNLANALGSWTRVRFSVWNRLADTMTRERRWDVW